MQETSWCTKWIRQEAFFFPEQGQCLLSWCVDAFWGYSSRVNMDIRNCYSNIFYAHIGRVGWYDYILGKIRNVMWNLRIRLNSHRISLIQLVGGHRHTRRRKGKQNRKRPPNKPMVKRKYLQRNYCIMMDSDTTTIYLTLFPTVTYGHVRILTLIFKG